MNEPSAKVIRDSISPDGHRLTTMEVVMSRFVLAEFNTHRVFSRNSASSRAVPLRKQLERVGEDPALPIEWASEKPGMQGGVELDQSALKEAVDCWNRARDEAMQCAQKLGELGVHKSIANRLLEPFMWHTVIVSSTEWSNFFGLRRSPLAQPEIRVAAEAMYMEYERSVPTQVGHGEWHMPYVSGDEVELLGEDAARRVSAARCARVSYLTHDGKRDPAKDLELYDRLTSAVPPHASPLEHVATPESGVPLGNFVGWRQLRHTAFASRAA
ncbi:MAG: FAD-dependent thymidylate synthase [Acidimicrobiales bacterium]